MSVHRPLELTGRAVRLREFGSDDREAVAAIVSDDRVTTFLSFESRTAEQVDGFLGGMIERAAATPRTEFCLAVEPLEDPVLVGFVRLALGGVRAAKIGYAINADHWGKGYATDAVRTMIDFAWTGLELHRITAAIGPQNAASIAVVERLGMAHEGRLRDHVHTNGAWRDSLLYSILAPGTPER